MFEKLWNNVLNHEHAHQCYNENILKNDENTAYERTRFIMDYNCYPQCFIFLHLFSLLLDFFIHNLIISY